MIEMYIVAAKRTIGPVLSVMSAYTQVKKDQHGMVSGAPFREFSEVLPEMSGDTMMTITSAGAVASVNLGYAFEQTLKLLLYLETGQSERKTHPLAVLLRRLPEGVQQKLEAIYESTSDWHDIEVQEDNQDTAALTGERNDERQQTFHRVLRRWDKHDMMQGARYKYADVVPNEPASDRRKRILIPLRAVMVGDRLLENAVAPRIGTSWSINPFGSYSGKPDLKWNPRANRIEAVLPDRTGSETSGSWIVGSVVAVRLREVGFEEWSPGFETPLGSGRISGLKPYTQYDVEVRYRKRHESDDVTPVMTFRHDTESSRELIFSAAGN